jgi:hypothetical protein
MQMYDLIAAPKIADVVYASRFYGRPHRSLHFHHYLGNRLISFIRRRFQSNADRYRDYKMMMMREVARSLLLSAERLRGVLPAFVVELRRLQKLQGARHREARRKLNIST